VLAVWISGGQRCIFIHSGQCLYSMPTGAKFDLCRTVRNVTVGVNLGVSVTILGGISGRRLSRQLSEGGAISGVDCTHMYVCMYMYVCVYIYIYIYIYI